MPILNPDFDPDWRASFERAKGRVDATHSADDLPAMHNAYWSQFRTMAEIRDFHIDLLRRKADAFGLELVVPRIDDDCTWEDISIVYSYLEDAINEQIAQRDKFPNKHPEGLNAFFDDDSAQRFTEYYQYTGFWDISSACHLTIEYQENEAHVCFTLLENAGTSPINMIETLATKVYHDELADRYDPEDVHWYTYHRFGGLWGHEGFTEALLSWDRRCKRYTRPQWMHFGAVPAAITKTTDIDGDAEHELVVRPRRNSAATGEQSP